MQKYCTHNTKASTHDQIDDSHKGMVKIANDALELIVKFSDHLYMNRRKWGENHKPFSFNHQMQQKKGTDVRVGTIVELNK